jgi:hypothetical protein
MNGRIVTTKEVSVSCDHMFHRYRQSASPTSAPVVVTGWTRTHPDRSFGIGGMSVCPVSPSPAHPSEPRFPLGLWEYVLEVIRTGPQPNVMQDAVRILAGLIRTNWREGMVLPIDRDTMRLLVSYTWKYPQKDEEQVIRFLFTTADPDTRQWLWHELEHAVCTKRPPPVRWAKFCAAIPPDMLPTVIPLVLDDMLHSPNDVVRACAIDTLAEWATHPDPAIRERARTALIDISIGDRADPSLSLRVRAIGVLMATNTPVDHRAVLRVLTDACASTDDHTVREAVKVIRTTIPVLGSRSAALLSQLISSMGDGPADMRITRIATVSRMVPDLLATVSDPNMIAHIVQAYLTQAYLTQAYGICLHERDELCSTVAKMLRQLLLHPGARAIIHDIAHTDPARICALPDPVRSVWLGAPWEPELTPHVLDLVEHVLCPHDPDVAAAVMKDGWGCGADARMVDIIEADIRRTSDPERWKPVLRRGTISSVGERVRRLWTTFFREPVVHVVMQEVTQESMRVPVPGHPSTTAPLSPDLIPFVCQSIRDDPHQVIPPRLLCRLWQTDPDTAYRMITMALHTNRARASYWYQALADGWGYGYDYDRAIADYVRAMHEAIHRSHNADYNPFGITVAQHMETATAGIGKAHPALMTDMLLHLFRTAPTRTRLAMLHALTKRWGTGGDDVIITVLRSFVAQERTSAASIEAMAKALSWGWGRGHDHAILSMLTTVLQRARRRKNPSRSDAYALWQVVTALAAGWRRRTDPTVDAPLMACIVDAIPHTIGPDSPYRLSTTIIFFSWHLLIRDSASYVEPQMVHTLLRRLTDYEPLRNVLHAIATSIA